MLLTDSTVRASRPLCTTRTITMAAIRRHSATTRNFVFDVGPHISFTKDPRIQDLFADSVDQQYETVQINLNNYWRGYWPRHPVQLHLHGLPEDVIVKVIADFVEERQGPERPVKNYADWLLSSFGRTFAELFPMQYTRKYHLTSADNMSTDWLGPRIYRPSLEEVLRGAISPSSPHVHYITHFRYPSRRRIRILSEEICSSRKPETKS